MCDCREAREAREGKRAKPRVRVVGGRTFVELEDEVARRGHVYPYYGVMPEAGDLVSGKRPSAPEVRRSGRTGLPEVIEFGSGTSTGEVVVELDAKAKRKAYRREWMARQRAAKKNGSSP
jgi:hypothetical protein